MNISKIYSIPGKSGLFELVAHNKTGAIMESIVDGKRLQVYSSDHISSLSEIQIYTTEKEKPLTEVLQEIFKKENGASPAVKPKDSPEQLKKFMDAILPNWDKDRVYASDIKKLVSWYNILLEKKLIDLEQPEITEADDAPVAVEGTQSTASK